MRQRRTANVSSPQGLQRIAGRLLVLITAALTIAMVALLIIGMPVSGSSAVTNDVIRLQQSFAKGSVQLAGIAIALTLLVAIARRLLKIKS